MAFSRLEDPIQATRALVYRAVAGLATRASLVLGFFTLPHEHSPLRLRSYPFDSRIARPHIASRNIL
jgi:hypothetical protein